MALPRSHLPAACSVSERVITGLLRFYCGANVKSLATAEYVTIVAYMPRNRVQFAGYFGLSARTYVLGESEGYVKAIFE